MNVEENFNSFHCAQCWGDVNLCKGSNRTREQYPGIYFRIPNDLLIPTCTKCGEIYICCGNHDLEKSLEDKIAAANKIATFNFRLIKTIRFCCVAIIVIAMLGIIQSNEIKNMLWNMFIIVMMFLFLHLTKFQIRPFKRGV